jgi:predicted transposase/invertase (TIGR01784 family)
MPWRMVSYMHAITEFYLQQHPKTKQLPVIIPLVLYNGKVKYPYTTELGHLYGDNADLIRAFMSYRFELIDLTQLPDDEISQHKKAALLEVVMKHIRDKSFVQLLTQIKQLLAVLDQAKEHDYVLIMLKYLLGCGEAEKVEPMLAALSEYLNPMLRSEIMTIAQRLEQRGIEKGKQEGIQEGIEKGIEKGIERGIEKGIRLEKQALAHRLMQKGLPLQTIAEVTELPLSLLEGMVAHDA